MHARNRVLLDAVTAFLSGNQFCGKNSSLLYVNFKCFLSASHACIVMVDRSKSDSMDPVTTRLVPHRFTIGQLIALKCAVVDVVAEFGKRPSSGCGWVCLVRW